MFAFIGFGCALLAQVPIVTLIGRWFIASRGKAMALAMLPISMLAVPYLIAELLPAYGRSITYLVLGSIFGALLPFLVHVVDRPEQVGQHPLGFDQIKKERSKDPVSGSRRSLSTKEILSNPSFWLLCLAVAVMLDSGTIFVVHIVPFGATRHLSLQQTALLLSVYSAAGVLGTALFGWLADRVGSYIALLVNAVSQALLWWVAVHVTGHALFVVATFMGICCIPVLALNGTALTDVFGVENIGKAVGYNYAFRLPFLFVAAPAIGYLYDRTGGYSVPFIALSIMVAASSLMLGILILRQRRQELA